MSQTKILSTGKPENYKNMDHESHVEPKLIELALFNNKLPEKIASETELSKTSKSNTRHNSKNNSSVHKSKSKRHVVQPYTKSKPKIANPRIRNEFTTFQQESNQNESLFRNDFGSMMPMLSTPHTDLYGSMQSMHYFPPNSTIFVPSMPYQSCPQQYSQQYRLVLLKCRILSRKSSFRAWNILIFRVSQAGGVDPNRDTLSWGHGVEFFG